MWGTTAQVQAGKTSALPVKPLRGIELPASLTEHAKERLPEPWAVKQIGSPWALGWPTNAVGDGQVLLHRSWGGAPHSPAPTPLPEAHVIAGLGVGHDVAARFISRLDNALVDCRGPLRPVELSRILEVHSLPPVPRRVPPVGHLVGRLIPPASAAGVVGVADAILGSVWEPRGGGPGPICRCDDSSSANVKFLKCQTERYMKHSFVFPPVTCILPQRYTRVAKPRSDPLIFEF